MITIPDKQTKKFTITNTSDLFGNILYTKNMNFDEEGYIKLSSRSLNVVDERDDSDMGIPLSFGRLFLSDFYNFVATSDHPFKVITSPTGGFSGTEDLDTNHPTLGAQTFGRWWRNLWHVTASSGGSATKLFYKNPSTGNWTDTGVTLTAGVIHPISVFRSKPLAAGQLAIGNGNTVIVLDDSYAIIITLVLPTDYEVIGLSYNNQRMGIIARLSSTAQGQNQEAYFFSWDGATSAANSGFPVGCDGVAGIVPYKSSWVILNSYGELLYFNGGGWEKLGQLPFFHTGYFWGNSYSQEALGDFMTVENDLIYLNVNNRFNQFGSKFEQYVASMPGGVWCYDPKVGLYQRYSPSISKASFLTINDGGVDISTNIITVASGTIPETGNPIKYLHSPLNIKGINSGYVYYVIRIDSTRFKLALTKQDAIDGNEVDITAYQGGIPNYFLAVNLLDYGASCIDRTGAVGLMGQLKYTFDHIIFGGEYTQYDTSNDYMGVCVTIGGFKNIGYLVTPKIFATNQITGEPDLEGLNEKLFIKYSPLAVGDKIVAKYKDTDINGIPVTTPQVGLSCQFSSNITTDGVVQSVLTTTADISEAYDYFNDDEENELECEITGGAGAGQMSQITDIQFDGTTYTITLEDALDGAVNTYYCDIIIDNWKLLKTDDDEDELTYENTKGWAEYPVTSKSKWIQYKIISSGVEVRLEQVVPISNTGQGLN